VSGRARSASAVVAGPAGAGRSRGVLSALRDYVLAPAPAPPSAPAAANGAEGAAASLAERPAIAASPPTITVFADPSDVAPLAIAVALLAAAAHRSPCALVVLRGARRAPAPGMFAAPAARRLAASLESRGIECIAAGRVVLVAPAGGEGATVVACAERALAAAAGAGAVAVAALGAPRERDLDRVVAACDLGLALLRPGQEPLLDLAVDGLAAVGVPATGAVAPVSAAARLVAARGLVVPASLRTVLAPLLASAGVQR
jgi:hypothetical protein